MIFVKTNNRLFGTNKMRKIFIFIFAFAAFAIPMKANTGDHTASVKQSLFTDFHSEEMVKLTITTNIDQLLTNRNTDQYQDAEVVWRSSNGNQVTLDAGIRARGKYRNRVCNFPPIKLKFSKKELTNLGYSSYNKMKLVTHCLEDEEAGNQNVIKEYLAYQLYNEITDLSFRVQLVEVEYIDSQYPEYSEKRYGIIIEHKKEMAARLNATIKEDLYNPPAAQIDADTEVKMALFNYLIGNEDYSISSYKNIEWIQEKTSGKLIPIPYDFDFSGFVNPSYAKAPVNHGLKSMTDRKYLGLPASNELLKQNINTFVAKKKALVQLVRTNQHLELDQRLTAIAYIRSFYSLLNDLHSSKEKSLYKALTKTPGKEESEGFYGHPLG